MQNEKINIKSKFKEFNDHWSPKIIAELNDYQFKIARIKGEFVWHKHDETDEAFIVIDGSMEIKFRDKKILLDNLYKIIEARMEEIFEKVHQEILNSGMSEKLSAGIVITGGGSQLLNLKQQVKYITGLDVRKGFPSSYLTKSEIVNLDHSQLIAVNFFKYLSNLGKYFNHF